MEYFSDPSDPLPILIAASISLVLIGLSALFSGLTLGLLSLNKHDLYRRAQLGDENAKKIYPIRKRGNELLSALLLGNVAVNTALSVFLGSLTSGIVAGVVATSGIFVFGEILPQAIIRQYALSFGARLSPFVRFVMIVFWPITYPLGKLLDRLLGDELPTLYSKHELMHIISEHEDSHASPIDEDEERILHGALQFSHTKVVEVMTGRDAIRALDGSRLLDTALRQEIINTGYSRFPVYRKRLDKVIGILYAKDVLIEPLTKSVEDACEEGYLIARPNETLDTILAHMLKRKKHMAMVIDHDEELVGVITLEDILEEVIQREIVDEDDHMVQSTRSLPS